MEALLILLCLAVLVVCIWLNILATIVVNHDFTLEPVQRKGQLVIVWLFPIVGAAFILRLLFQHYPDAIPEKWIPWPFRGLVYGKEHPRNRSRNEDESPAVNCSHLQGRGNGSGAGGDGGGSD